MKWLSSKNKYMFPFGRKGRWVSETNKQGGRKEKKFVDPDETGPTRYDELLEEAEDATSNDELIYKTSKDEEDIYMLQEQLIDEGKREWAKAIENREKKLSRQEREQHNDAKGGERISDQLGEGDNTEYRQREILKSLDDIAA